MQKRLTIVRDREFSEPLRLVDVRSLRNLFGIVWIELQGLRNIGEGILGFSSLQECFCPAEIGACIVGFQANSAVVICDGPVVIALGVIG